MVPRITRNVRVEIFFNVRTSLRLLFSPHSTDRTYIRTSTLLLCSLSAVNVYLRRTRYLVDEGRLHILKSD